MAIVSIVNVVFWAIMALAFFILYSKGKEFTKVYEKEIDPIGKTVLMHPTQDGPVVDDAILKLQPVFKVIKSIFKLSEYAMFISVVAAIITVVIGLTEFFNIL
jgi:hypothetical protein